LAINPYDEPLLGPPQTGLIRSRWAPWFAFQSSWRSASLQMKRPPMTLLTCGDATPGKGWVLPLGTAFLPCPAVSAEPWRSPRHL